ncbi:MAG: hypothetical protein GXO79_09400 [Chlorobi bacterium]|nr:hypothetical protein [Chlorobiota bacterium]
MNILEIIGYVASVIIATSMMMNSILKLRWINLAGASLFSMYGFIIGALPVGFLNLFIVSVDIYYLIKIYSKKEYFKTLDVRNNNKYLIAFLDFYKNEIQKFFPGFRYKPEMNTVSFFILRNMAVAGIILAREIKEKTLFIALDFVIPQYRDFKLGKFIYTNNDNYFSQLGYDKICIKSRSKKFTAYLKKMGFIETMYNNEMLFSKQLHKK